MQPSRARDIATIWAKSGEHVLSLEKPRPIDFYKEEARDMMMEVVSNGELPPPQHHQQPPPPMLLGAESSGEDPEMEIKVAETWVQDETQSLIGLRREMDSLFNTSKSNKHLWEQISAKMREKGFDRSPTMCTDKWRNLLKEFKKAKHQDSVVAGRFILQKIAEEFGRK